jgi:NTE family protein
MSVKKIGLALGGGGARGICHIAFLEALDEMGIEVSMISGTSIGALIGALYASGLSGSDIREMLNKIRFKDIVEMVDLKLFGTTSLVKGRGVKDFLQKNMPVHTFEKLKIPLKIVATDFWAQKQVILENGDLVSAIMASICIPAVFEPVLRDQHVLVDGGIANNVPFDILKEHSRTIVAIDVAGSVLVPEDTKKPHMVENLMLSFEILQKALLDEKLKYSCPDIHVKPSLNDIGILDFKKAKEILASVENDVILFKKDLEILFSENEKGRSLWQRFKGLIR